MHSCMTIFGSPLAVKPNECYTKINEAANNTRTTITTTTTREAAAKNHKQKISSNHRTKHEMDFSLQRSEIEQFLHDVRDHFRASLETSEYENTSNLFHVTAAEATARLLLRCEQLLAKWATHSAKEDDKESRSRYAAGGKQEKPTASDQDHEDSYLDMTARNNSANQNQSHSKSKKLIAGSREYIDLASAMSASTASDKTFRCSSALLKGMPLVGGDGCPLEADISTSEGTTRGNGELMCSVEETGRPDEHADSDNDEDNGSDNNPQIYDICQVSQFDFDEIQKAITPDSELMQSIECPYMDLPAGHLSIQRSSKYGQLQRIEKRLFFDQSKKCYCGILNDWLLVYADGPTSSQPSMTLHLKSNGIEIEHSGEGKRREICFQITTADPNKKFVFQAVNEVDAKEWIHAIEAAIRGDSPHKSSRKLPTPPIMKKLTFLNSKESGISSDNSQADYIYEEPSPLYHVHEPTDLLITQAKAATSEQPPELPEKVNSPTAMAKKFEYDVPKCPAQPIKVSMSTTPSNETPEGEVISLLIGNSGAKQRQSTSMTEPKASGTGGSEKLDFQTKVKDVHSKLSSQLSAGPTGAGLKKALKKTYTSCAQEIEPVSSPTKTPPSVKEQKKQKKSNTPQGSPQKFNLSGSNSSTNGPNNNNNNNNTNSNSNIITISPSAERSARNWFLNRLNKTTSTVRNSSIVSPIKCKQSEKENLLNSLDICDSPESAEATHLNGGSPILKGTSGGQIGQGKSKVNMIINKFEANGHLAMFSMEALAGSAVASLSSFCESNDCNYEPIMTMSSPASSLLKKV